MYNFCEILNKVCINQLLFYLALLTDTSEGRGLLEQIDPELRKQITESDLLTSPHKLKLFDEVGKGTYRHMPHANNVA